MSYTHANDSIPKSVILYTPYTKISVSPGASIDYSIDLINNTDQLTNANLSVSGLSASWKHEMKSGGWSLSQLSVLPKEKKTFNLKVEVPLKVNKGNYHFVVYAGSAKLPLDVVVAQKGTYQTEFTTDQPNMQGNSKSTFTFSATLKNQTADQHARCAEHQTKTHHQHILDLLNIVGQPGHKRTAAEIIDVLK